MFYVKTKSNEGTTIKIELTTQNMFTICPDCGEEFSVDLQSLFDSKNNSIENAVYCSACLKIRKDLKEKIDYELDSLRNNVKSPIIDTANLYNIYHSFTDANVDYEV